MDIPEGLRWLESTSDGAAWLAELPTRIEVIARRWALDVGHAYSGSNVSWVAPANREGEAVVIKLQWPHPECEHEADALRTWGGDGAVRLLDHDEEHHALLIERCSPGTHLSEGPTADATAVMADLIGRLSVPATGVFRSLAEEAAGWSASLFAGWEAAGRPCERRLVDEVEVLMSDLASSQGEQVLVHQDLHGDNVLAAERSAWLAIDPKPLEGEREFACAPVIRSFEFGHSRSAVLARLDELSSALDLDRDRCRGWATVQTMAWSFSSAHMQRHHDTVRWLLDA